MNDDLQRHAQMLKFQDAQRVTITLELDYDQRKAIAAVRAGEDDIAFDEREPASADECREHLEGFVELAGEESNPEHGQAPMIRGRSTDYRTTA